MLIRYKQEEIQLPEGSCAKDLAEKLNQRGPDQALAVKLNGKMMPSQYSISN
jgi:threonyl-tRNA synthetase